MAIGKIITGQTFGNWLNTTNLLVDEINQATPSFSQGKLVRWGAGGVITVNALTTSTLKLAGSNNTVNAISSDWSTPIDDFTLMTSNAVHHSILNTDTIRLIHPTRVTSTNFQTVTPSANNVEIFVDSKPQVTFGESLTVFHNNVEFKKDLTVLGTRTEINVQQLEVEDANIQLNKGSNSAFWTANNAGFDVGYTNAFMRLINTGTVFPVSKNMNARINPNYKLLQIDTTGTLSYITQAQVDINEKDRVEILYPYPDQVLIDTNINPFYQAKDFVLGIGTISDTTPVPFPDASVPYPPTSPYNRENFALDPAFGEIEYSVTNTNGTFSFTSFNDYKQAFSTALASDNPVFKLSFDPDNSRQLYYWTGTIAPEVYDNREVSYHTDASGDMIFEIDLHDRLVAPSFSTEDNPTFQIYTGDTIEFKVELARHNTYPFFIGTTPYTDPNRKTPQKVFMGPLSASNFAEVTVDGVTHINTNISAYETDFKDPTKKWANTKFLASQPGRYYYWADGNTADPHFKRGGMIEVFPRNENMGGSITVEYPMGKKVTKAVTLDPATLAIELDSIPKDTVTLEAGDTVEFTLANHAIMSLNGNANAFIITDSGNNPLDYVSDGVLYLSDGLAPANEYKIWSDYANNFTSNSVSTVRFTPFAPGTYRYFANTTPSEYGEIVVLTPKPYNLDAFHISVDNYTATIENPIKFVVTKDKYPTMELDGELADFIGTKNGIRLPNNSYDYTPNSNGIIRYNDALNLFEGYTQGQWRGLGGVVDLNQDTYVETDDFNDTIYFVANNANVSQMREDKMFFETNREETIVGVSHKESHVRVESNSNTLNYNVHVEGNANTFTSTGWVAEGGRSGLVIDHRGIDIDSTGYLKLPYGSINDRPYFAANGMVRMIEDGLEVVDSANNTERFDILELHVEGKWQPLSFVTNEYTYTVNLPGSNTVSFGNLYTPFVKEEIEVHLNGLKIEKADFDIISTPNNVHKIAATFTPGPPNGDYNLGLTLPFSVDAGDRIEISANNQGLFGNTAAIAIGIADPLTPGSFIPAAGVDYYVGGVKYNFNDYLGEIANTDVLVGNTIDIVYTTSPTTGTFQIYSTDPTSVTITGNQQFYVTGRTSYTSNLMFQTNRNPGQIINVKHAPGRNIGVNHIDVLSRSELINGLASNIRFSGQVTIGSYQASTSTTTGALIVLGGLGMSGDLFVGKSVTELSASDLKTNISSIDSALDKVIAMKGVEFNWKDDIKDTKEYGLIAEDVASIAPSLVSYADNKPQGVKYSKVVALLIEAMKQQQNEIETLKSQLPKKRGRKSNSTKE